MKDFTLLSYNLWFHKAFPELPQLVRAYDADVLCLQECHVKDLTPLIAKLKLTRADPIQKGIGQVMYVNQKRWAVENDACFNLPEVPYERASRQRGRPRLQLLSLKSKYNQHRIVVGNVHIAHLLAGQRGRRKQAVRAAELTAEVASDKPAILAGDFNYPFRGHGLIAAIATSKLTAIDHETPTYHHWPKRTFDRIFIKDLHVKEFQVLPFGTSDHAPIMGRFAISSPDHNKQV